MIAIIHTSVATAQDATAEAKGYTQNADSVSISQKKEKEAKTDTTTAFATTDNQQFSTNRDSSFMQTADSMMRVADEQIKRKNTSHFTPDPTKATLYALVCPGLGQIYNRSYWKVPIVYGGIVTLGYLISWNGRVYNDYKNAYYDICIKDPNSQSYKRMVSRYTENDDQWLKNTLKRKRDLYRRYRDMSIFGMVGLYILSVVDSFVDAHLYDFTVSDDLSLRMEPMVKPAEYNDNGLNYSPAIYGLQCSVTF